MKLAVFVVDIDDPGLDAGSRNILTVLSHSLMGYPEVKKVIVLGPAFEEKPFVVTRRRPEDT